MEKIFTHIGSAGAHLWGLFWHLDGPGRIAMALAIIGLWTTGNWAIVIIQQVVIWTSRDRTPKM